MTGAFERVVFPVGIKGKRTDSRGIIAGNMAGMGVWEAAEKA